MATVSSSAADFGRTVQAVHAGLNYAFAAYNSGGNKTPFSGSVSDAIVMFNMPRNAQVIAAYIGGWTDDGNMGFTLGDPSSTSRFGGPLSISGTTINLSWFTNGAVGYTYSISDDQSSWPLTLNLANATSVSGSISVHVGVIWKKL